MTAVLHICAKGESQERELFCGAMVTIGRVPPNDVVLPDPKVSRNHAILRVMGDGKYYLMDVGSSNGTSVNGRRIMIPHALKHDDLIGIGDSTLTFSCDVSSGGKTIPAAHPEVPSTMLTLGGMVKVVTLLVADIRGFTSLTEKTEPRLLAMVLGRLFRDITKAVESHGGVVDKFIGDAVMARWVEEKQGVAGTVRAALATAVRISHGVEEVNKEFRDMPQQIQMGVGINSGQAMLGNVGTSSSRDYTAVGDAVNIAFRLEAASKELGKDVIVGADSFKYLPKALWEKTMSTVKVKGKKDALTVWGVSFVDLGRMLPEIMESSKT